jgi:hypothetical protein
MEINNTLEWTPVEHIHGNWPGEIPEVIVGLMTTVIHLNDGFCTSKCSNERR